MNENLLEHLQQLEANNDYHGLIAAVKEAIGENGRHFTHPFIKRWCGIRWRNLFLSEALSDARALKKADNSRLLGRKDKRPDKQKLAEQFLRGDEIREWKLELPEFERTGKTLNTSLVFAPGLLNGMLPVRAFQSAFPELEKNYGIRIIRADSHPMRSCKENSADLLAAIEQGAGLAADTRVIDKGDQTPPRDFILIGYSKGAPDIYQMLSERPDLQGRIRCIFNWGGAIGGSYLADDIYLSIKDLDIPKIEKKLASFLAVISPAINVKSGALRRMEEYNVKEAVYDLTTEARSQFLNEHAELLQSMDIPIFNVTGSTNALDAPYFQIQGVLAINRYDANNDMQLTQAQAKLDLPMATDLAILRAHHWDMSYDPFPKLMRFGSPNLDHPFPKLAAVTAMIQLCIELGIID